MSKVVSPAAVYCAMAAAARSISIVRPSRSMSAICHRPVMTREIERPGARSIRSTLLRRQYRDTRLQIDPVLSKRAHLAQIDEGSDRHHDDPQKSRSEVPGVGRGRQILPRV